MSATAVLVPAYRKEGFFTANVDACIDAAASDFHNGYNHLALRGAKLVETSFANVPGNKNADDLNTCGLALLINYMITGNKEKLKDAKIISKNISVLSQENFGL